MWKSVLGGLAIGLAGLFFSANVHFVSRGDYILKAIFSLLLFLTVVLSALGLEILRRLRGSKTSDQQNQQDKTSFPQ